MTRPCVLLVAVALLVSGPARAEDVSDLEGLLNESVISGASRSAETASTAPATSSTLTAEDLRRYGIRSLDQALNFLSLGMITENPQGVVEIGSRGVLLTRDYGNHVLVLVDGHVLNEPWNGTAYFERGLGIPLELVDHIEVILGPGSVLYGSNAMLGVINVVTKRAKDFAGAHGMVDYEYVNALRGAVALGKEFSLLGQRAEVVGQLEYFGSRGPELDYGLQGPIDDSVTGQPKQFSPGAGRAPGYWGGLAGDSLYMQVPSGYVRLDVGELQLSLRGAMFKRWTPHQWNWANFDDPNGYELDRWASLDLRYRRILNPVVTLTLRGYGDLYSYRSLEPTAAAEDCDEGQLGGCNYVLYGVSRWTGLEASSELDWLRDARLVTTVGVDGRLRYLGDEDGFFEPGEDPPLQPAGLLEQTVGAYLQQTARPFQWLGLNAGARLDYEERFGVALSPRFAASVPAWSGGVLKAVYAEAFRAPTLYEIAYEDVSEQVRAVDLAPERVRSAEASLEQRLGSQRLLVGAFVARWSDLVVSEQLDADEIAAAQSRGELTHGVTEAYQYRNAARIEDAGLNLRFEGTQLSQRLRYGLGATVARARRVEGSDESELPGAARLFGNARVSYDFGGALPVLALAVRHAGRRLAVDGTNLPDPVAPPQTELRLAVSGQLPALREVGYRLTTNYAFSDRAPYAIGPLGTSLLPVRRFEVGFGLQYDLR